MIGKNLSLKIKLPGFIGSSLFLLSLVIIILAVTMSINALKESNLKQLSSVRVAKADHIKDYMESNGSLIISQAESKMVQDAFTAFQESFYKMASDSSLKIKKVEEEVARHYQDKYINKINFDVPGVSHDKSVKKYMPQSKNAKLLQYWYIIRNKNNIGEKNKLNRLPEVNFNYSQAHSVYHSSFNRIMQEYQLYDVFLIDNKGNVIYSVYKEKDFATNLLKGPYKESGLARVYKKALKTKKGEAVLEDFSPYTPSYNASASFIGSPVYKNGQLMGVLAYQVSIKRINAIMSFGGKYKDAGLGESGECYLIGKDYTMRNDSRFLKDIKNNLVQKLKTTIGIFKIKSPSVERGLAGKQGAWIINDYRGIKVLSSYGSINIFGLTWVIIAEVDESEGLKGAYLLRNLLIIIPLIITIVFILFGVFFSNNIVHRLQDFVVNFKKGTEGFLNIKVDVQSKDEIGELGKSFNSFMKKLKEIVSSIIDSSNQVLQATSEVSQGNQDLSNRVSAQSASLEETASSIEEMTANLKNMAEKSVNTQEVVGSTSRGAEEGKREIEKAVTSIQSVNEQASRISEIVKIIDSIAFQTNILALNAAVEAARAKEHGKGFAVVANEVRNLAQKSAENAKQIESMIGSIVKGIEEGNRQVGVSQGKFMEIQEDIDKSSTLISDVSASAEEQSNGVDQINQAISHLDEITQNNASLVEELSASTEELESQTREVIDMMSFFKI